MSGRKPAACVAIALGALSTVAASPAVAQDAPKRASVTAIGGVEFKVNRRVADTMRFNKDRVTIRSGGTLTVRNRTVDPESGDPAPHTISLARRSDLPRNSSQMEACFGPEGVCGRIAASHGVTGPDDQPDVERVNVGASGFDVAGDSALFVGEPLRLKVTAKAGTTLNCICIIHPWMQGRISVK